MHPKMITRIVVRQSEFSGRPSFSCTLEKDLEYGTPPSRANAYVIREDVVMMEVVAKRRQTSGNMRTKIRGKFLSRSLKNLK